MAVTQSLQQGMHALQRGNRSKNTVAAARFQVLYREAIHKTRTQRLMGIMLLQILLTTAILQQRCCGQV